MTHVTGAELREMSMKRLSGFLSKKGRPTRFPGWTRGQIEDAAKSVGITKSALCQRIRAGKDPFAPAGYQQKGGRTRAANDRRIGCEIASTIDARKAQIAARQAAEAQEEE